MNIFVILRVIQVDEILEDLVCLQGSSISKDYLTDTSSCKGHIESFWLGKEAYVSVRVRSHETNENEVKFSSLETVYSSYIDSLETSFLEELND